MTTGDGTARGDTGPYISIVGRVVAYSYDDSPSPLTGRVIDQVDGDSVTVAWGSEKYKDNPRTSTEYIDELRPVDGRDDYAGADPSWPD